MDAGLNLSRESLTNRVWLQSQEMGFGASVEDGSALGATWRSLLAGEARIIETFWTSDRLGMTIVSRPREARVPVSARHAAILEEVLLDAPAKAVSIDWKLAPSSTATLLKQALTSMGLSCLPSRVPLLLVVAACAARTSSASCPVRVGEQPTGDVVYRTITLHAPSVWLAQRLTARQCHVAQLRVAANSLTEIAESCAISTRTVANHLRAIYQRLGVSARSELLSTLANHYVQGEVTAAENREMS